MHYNDGDLVVRKTDHSVVYEVINQVFLVDELFLMPVVHSDNLSEELGPAYAKGKTSDFELFLEGELLMEGLSFAYQIYGMTGQVSSVYFKEPMEVTIFELPRVVLQPWITGEEAERLNVIAGRLGDELAQMILRETSCRWKLEEQENRRGIFIG